MAAARTATSWLALALVACGTGTLSVPTNENTGVETRPRLRAKVWEADGVSLFRWFRDSERKEDCAFVQGGIANTGPGPTYWCLPLDAVRHDATGGLALFGDEACRVPVALALPSGDAPYVIQRGVSSCREHPRVFRAEASQRVQPYFFDGGACVRAATTVPVQTLGEEIPLASFVSAIETVVPSTGSIARLDLVTSDGARQTIGGFDEARNFSVSVGDPGGTGDLRWIPSRLAFEGAGTVVYSDAACTAGVPTKVARDAVCPLDASFEFAGSCGDGSFFALGPTIEPARLHEKTPLGDCVAAANETLVAHARGDVIVRTSLVAAKPFETGTGRIRLRGHGGDGGDVKVSDFFDAQTKTVCTPTTMADGQTRCLPAITASVALFADAACTQPAFEEPLGECALPKAPSFVRDGLRAFRVAGEVTRTYAKDGAACTAHTPTAPVRAFQLEEVDSATFAVVTEQTR